MNKRQSIKTTIKEAIDHWSNHIDESSLSVDWSEAHTHCWRCGYEKNLERCHIIPHALGGLDEPANIVLLCKRCHAEGPNVTDPEIMWDWIYAYKIALYETFWSIMGMKEYKFIYQKGVMDEIKDIIAASKVSENPEYLETLFNIHLQATQKEASIHFGQPYFNSATMAGRYRMMLKEIARSLNVAFPLKYTNENKPTKPWWTTI